MKRKTCTAIAMLLLCACAVGPDYVRPKMATPAQFKETPKNALPWKQAEPKDDLNRGDWWQIFGDSGLDTLEAQVAVSNQNVKAAEAQFRAARALIAEARSGFFPSVSATASENRAKASAGRISSAGTSGSSPINTYEATLAATWELDIWGSIRRTVEANEANAQVSAANLAAATLSAQSTLAVAYIDLRMADKQKRLLTDTVANDKRALDITLNQYHSGVAARSDVVQAKAQLESAQAQLIDVGVQRAQYEHAIAILIGKAPADFSLPSVNSVPAQPTTPSMVPSELLERRPDIAASERQVAAANAEIGVAKAAFFPSLTLSATGGYESSQFARWFTLPARMWSIGPSLVETVFDAGLHAAQSEAAIATYDQTVAAYRQTVLTAFQQVEDNLVAIRVLAEEQAAQDRAVADAHTATVIAINQYKAGTVSYLSVVTAQNTELTDELSAITIEKGRLTAAANLIMGLGGGWNASELNKPEVTTPKTTPFTILPPPDPDPNQI